MRAGPAGPGGFVMSLSCDQARLMVSDLLAGAIAPAEVDPLEAHLAQCESCRSHARAYCRLDRALNELTAQQRLAALQTAIQASLAEESPVVAPPARRRSWRRVRWGLAAAILLLAVGAAWWLNQAPAGIARLDVAEGEVYIVTGETRELARAGYVLRPGQGVQTGEESRAVVVDRDGRQLYEMGPDSTVSGISEGPGNASKRVSLLAG